MSKHPNTQRWLRMAGWHARTPITSRMVHLPFFSASSYFEAIR
jgi:hypothetical protein